MPCRRHLDLADLTGGPTCRSPRTCAHARTGALVVRQRARWSGPHGDEPASVDSRAGGGAATQSRNPHAVRAPRTTGSEAIAGCQLGRPHRDILGDWWTRCAAECPRVRRCEDCQRSSASPQNLTQRLTGWGRGHADRPPYQDTATPDTVTARGGNFPVLAASCAGATRGSTTRRGPRWCCATRPAITTCRRMSCARTAGTRWRSVTCGAGRAREHRPCERLDNQCASREIREP